MGKRKEHVAETWDSPGLMASAAPQRSAELVWKLWTWRGAVPT